ncbi:MAG: bi-domain-containing oxidoreductase [Proteobacteria bacterium]|nr:bi-domain-containing oxidoreductase [Pseudomonadota bacterium]
MQITEVPLPNLQQGMLLVRNLYSVISAGTESGTVKAARKGYLGKALEKPQQVRQVLDTLKAQGPLQTYRAVMKKLDAWSPLGYSCVGEVVDVAHDVNEFKVGDLVGCGGATASHAEVVVVPKNLCVEILQGSRFKVQGSKDINEHLKMAAYNTLGAIAMQGVRQADLRLGETCAVIGLGLLGQLTATLLTASGVKVVGIDIDRNAVDFSIQHGFHNVFNHGNAGIENKINELTYGIGCDAAIITAASESLDPINFAGAISRKRGTIVIVGAVPTGFDRDPHFYKKELTVRMSCSYGPGRYDSEYEEKGHDYPVGHVRWTEKRNMQAFQDLLVSGKMDISHLTTHVFKLEDAPKAYDMILQKSEPYVGILIEYDRNKELNQFKVQGSRFKVQGSVNSTHRPSPVSIGFIGAGSYAQSHLLPNIPKSSDISLKGVMTSSPISSRSAMDRFGFQFCTSCEDDIFSSDEINTVFIAARHNSHADYVIKALKAGKHVFVEKPLCITEDELYAIVEEVRKFGSSEVKQNPILPSSHLRTSAPPVLMVGFNRRFSPLTGIIREKLGAGTMSMIYRVNAGFIPNDSWSQDREIGGGRILGEVCHFVDYLTYCNGSLPKSVYAVAIDDAYHNHDTLTVSLKYENGSIGSIEYFANGSKSLAKEYIEIYKQGTVAVLNDFRELTIYEKGKPFKKKLLSQDKGQKMEVNVFLDAVQKGYTMPIPISEIFSTTEVTFKILESLRTRQVVAL